MSHALFAFMILLFVTISTASRASAQSSSSSASSLSDVTNYFEDVYFKSYSYCTSHWTSPSYTLLFGKNNNDSSSSSTLTSPNVVVTAENSRMSLLFLNNSMTVKSSTEAGLRVFSKFFGKDVVVKTSSTSSASPQKYNLAGFGLPVGDCQIEEPTGVFSVSEAIPAAELRFQLFSENDDGLVESEQQLQQQIVNGTNSSHNNNSTNNFDPSKILSALCSQSVQQVQFTTFASTGLSDTSWLHYFSAIGNLTILSSRDSNYYNNVDEINETNSILERQFENIVSKMSQDRELSLSENINNNTSNENNVGSFQNTRRSIGPILVDHSPDFSSGDGLLLARQEIIAPSVFVGVRDELRSEIISRQQAIASIASPTSFIFSSLLNNTSSSPSSPSSSNSDQLFALFNDTTSSNSDFGRFHSFPTEICILMSKSSRGTANHSSNINSTNNTSGINATYAKSFQTQNHIFRFQLRHIGFLVSEFALNRLNPPQFSRSLLIMSCSNSYVSNSGMIDAPATCSGAVSTSSSLTNAKNTLVIVRVFLKNFVCSPIFVAPSSLTNTTVDNQTSPATNTTRTTTMLNNNSNSESIGNNETFLYEKLAGSVSFNGGKVFCGLGDPLLLAKYSSVSNTAALLQKEIDEVAFFKSHGIHYVHAIIGHVRASSLSASSPSETNSSTSSSGNFAPVVPEIYWECKMLRSLLFSNDVNNNTEYSISSSTTTTIINDNVIHAQLIWPGITRDDAAATSAIAVFPLPEVAFSTLQSVVLPLMMLVAAMFIFPSLMWQQRATRAGLVLPFPLWQIINNQSSEQGEDGEADGESFTSTMKPKIAVCTFALNNVGAFRSNFGDKNTRRNLKLFRLILKTEIDNFCRGHGPSTSLSSSTINTTESPNYNQDSSRKKFKSIEWVAVTNSFNDIEAGCENEDGFDDSSNDIEDVFVMYSFDFDLPSMILCARSIQARLDLVREVSMKKFVNSDKNLLDPSFSLFCEYYGITRKKFLKLFSATATKQEKRSNSNSKMDDQKATQPPLLDFPIFGLTVSLSVHVGNEYDFHEQGYGRIFSCLSSSSSSTIANGNEDDTIDQIERDYENLMQEESERKAERTIDLLSRNQQKMILNSTRGRNEMTRINCGDKSKKHENNKDKNSSAHVKNDTSTSNEAFKSSFKICGPLFQKAIQFGVENKNNTGHENYTEISLSKEAKDEMMNFKLRNQKADEKISDSEATANKKSISEMDVTNVITGNSGEICKLVLPNNSGAKLVFSRNDGAETGSNDDSLILLSSVLGINNCNELNGHRLVMIKIHLELEADFDEQPKEYISAFFESHLALVQEFCQKFVGAKVEAAVNGDFFISFNNNDNTNISNNKTSNDVVSNESEGTCRWYLFCDQISKVLSKGRFWKEFEREKNDNRRRMVLQVLDDVEEKKAEEEEERQKKHQKNSAASSIRRSNTKETLVSANNKKTSKLGVETESNEKSKNNAARTADSYFERFVLPTLIPLYKQTSLATMFRQTVKNSLNGLVSNYFSTNVAINNSNNNNNNNNTNNNILSGASAGKPQNPGGKNKLNTTSPGGSPTTPSQQHEGDFQEKQGTKNNNKNPAPPPTSPSSLLSMPGSMTALLALHPSSAGMPSTNANPMKYFCHKSVKFVSIGVSFGDYKKEDNDRAKDPSIFDEAEALELRHRELCKELILLQEQRRNLNRMSAPSSSPPPSKKTGNIINNNNKIFESVIEEFEHCADTCCVISGEADIIRQRQFDNFFPSWNSFLGRSTQQHQNENENENNRNGADPMMISTSLASMIACRKTCWIGATNFGNSQDNVKNIGTVVLMKIQEKNDADLKMLLRMYLHKVKVIIPTNNNNTKSSASSSSSQNAASTCAGSQTTTLSQNYEHYRNLQPFMDINLAMKEFFGKVLLGVKSSSSSLQPSSSSFVCSLPLEYVTNVLTPEQRTLRRYSIAVLRREWSILSQVVNKRQEEESELLSLQRNLLGEQNEILSAFSRTLDEIVVAAANKKRNEEEEKARNDVRKENPNGETLLLVALSNNNNNNTNREAQGQETCLPGFVQQNNNNTSQEALQLQNNNNNNNNTKSRDSQGQDIVIERKNRTATVSSSNVKDASATHSTPSSSRSCEEGDINFNVQPRAKKSKEQRGKNSHDDDENNNNNNNDRGPDRTKQRQTPHDLPLQFDPCSLYLQNQERKQ